MCHCPILDICAHPTELRSCISLVRSINGIEETVIVNRQSGLAAILAAMRSAGVAPEVDLMIPSHTADRAHNKSIHIVFKTQDRGH